VLQELTAIVPNLPSLAVQPILLGGTGEPGMFDHFRRYPWVLPIYEYDNPTALLATLSGQVIDPVEAELDKLRGQDGSKSEGS
jgi:hypothetical protein